MKTYIHEGKVIREDELKEITLPEVGDRFRRNKQISDRPDVITILGATDRHVTASEIKGSITHDYLFTNFEPIPSPPVCPPELMPLPDGAVYLGKGMTFNDNFIARYCRSRAEDVWDDGSYGGGVCCWHYATTAGDACHRSQSWFDESQAPSVKTDASILTKGFDFYPPPESKWPEKPAPPEGCEWVRMPMDGNKEGKSTYIMLKSGGRWGVLYSIPWENCVVFRAVPIDHTEGGKYRMLERGEIVEKGDHVMLDSGGWLEVNGLAGSRNRWSFARRPITPTNPLESAFKTSMDQCSAASGFECFAAGYAAGRGMQ